MNSLLERIDKFLKNTDIVNRLFKFILGVVVVTGTLAAWLTSNTTYAIWLRDNFVYVWLFGLTLCILMIFNLVYDFRKKFIEGYTVNLRRDPSHVWQSRDGSVYKTNRDHDLIVTNSFEGCITRMGNSWENYDLFFEAMITHACIGVIFRAESINDYHMFQITTDGVIFYRKSLLPAEDGKIETDKDGNMQIKMPNFGILWQSKEKKPYKINANEWYKFRVNVDGDTATLYIAGKPVCSESPLQISTGRIGFRNDGAEHALVKNIKVVLHPYE